MWFATDMGVSRFDGYEFQNFSTKEGLPDNTVFNIYEDYRGRIWFISFSGRLSYYQGGAIQTFEHNEALEQDVTQLFKSSFHVNPEDELYIGTGTNGYLTISTEGAITHYTLDSS